MDTEDDLHCSQNSNTSSIDDLLNALKDQYPGAVVEVVKSTNCGSTSGINGHDEQQRQPDSLDDGNLSISGLDNIMLDPNSHTGDLSFSFDILDSDLSLNTVGQVETDNLDQGGKLGSTGVYVPDNGPTNTNGVAPENFQEDMLGIETVVETVQTVEENDHVNRTFGLQDADDEDPDDPDFEPGENEEHSEEADSAGDDGRQYEDNALGVIKKKRRRIASPRDWIDRKNKDLREKGQKYVGWSRKKLLDENSGETVYKGKRGTVREERKLGPPCQSSACLKSKVRDCYSISEEDRQTLYDSFWKTLSWDQKKIYIASLVKRTEKSRTKTKKGEDSRRQHTFVYTIKLPNGKSVEVCKKLFLSTFSLGEWSVHSWATGSSEGHSHGMTPSQNAVNEERRKIGSIGKIRNVEGRRALETFLESLPKLPSHYCRKNSSKLYLEPGFGKSWVNVYNEYVKVCFGDGTNPVKPLSQCVFDNFVKEKNLAFQQPKKDRCDKCIMYETGNLDEENYRDHIEKKEKARKEKENDIKEAKKGSSVVLTMDVQSVKVSPSLNASALYYKTKLVCHNFTIYDVVTHDTKCYWYNESQADLCASTFASCVVEYLEEMCDCSKPIIIYSDGCTAQNRNSTMSNALLCFSKEKNVQIEQKFLTKGHTQMEVDSIHSLIERKVKDQKIHLPSDYIRLTEMARKSPIIRTKVVEFDFPKDYGKKSLLVYDSIRPGRKPGEPKVTNIKAIKYANGEIEVKLKFDETYFVLPQRVKRSCPSMSSFPVVRNAPIPITHRKWQHLQQLKEVIPRDCHAFYDQLPHEGS